MNKLTHQLKMIFFVLCYTSRVQNVNGNFEVTAAESSITHDVHDVYKTAIITIKYEIPLPVDWVSVEWFKKDSLHALFHTKYSEDPKVVTYNQPVNDYDLGGPELNKKLYSSAFVYYYPAKLSNAGTFYANVSYRKDGTTIFGRSPDIGLIIHDSPRDLQLIIRDGDKSYPTEGKEAKVDCVSKPYFPNDTDRRIYNGSQPIDCQTTPDPSDSEMSLVSLCPLFITFSRWDRLHEWVCEVTWKGRIFRSSVIKPNVTFLATNLTMSTYLPERLPENEDAPLTCETDSAYPIATITWKRDGAKLVSGRFHIIINTPRPGDFDAFIQTSTVYVRGSTTQQRAEFTCSVEDVESLPSRSDRLIVEVAPIVVFTVLNRCGQATGVSSSKYNEGETACIECTSTPTLPYTAQVTIYRGSEIMCLDQDEAMMSGSFADTEGWPHDCSFNHTFTREENTMKWTCIITWNGKEHQTTPYDIEVLFLPHTLTMNTPPPETGVLPGTELKITCQSGSSNPLTSGIDWAINGALIVKSDDIHILNTFGEGEYFGKLYVSMLSFPALMEYDGAVIECILMDKPSLLANDTLNIQRPTTTTDATTTATTTISTTIEVTPITEVPTTPPVATADTYEGNTASTETTLETTNTPTTQAVAERRQADIPVAQPKDNSSIAISAGVGGVIGAIAIASMIALLAYRKKKAQTGPDNDYADVADKEEVDDDAEEDEDEHDSDGFHLSSM